MKFRVSTPQKIVAFLQASLSKRCSGKELRRLLEASFCRVNGRVERFGSTLLQRGDVVELSSAWQSLLLSNRSSSFETLYEDDDFLLVNKPSGWVCTEENTRRTFGPHLMLVHRLDKETTGVLALAKTLRSRDELMACFANREVSKEYLAIVDGVPREEKGTRETYLTRKRMFAGQTIWGSGKRGLHAITHWKKMNCSQNASLLLCQPLTGRTHQIRVHLAEMGHPILVDRQYAASFRCPRFASRPLLHASRLQFGNILGIAPLPSDMKDFLKNL